MNAIPGNPAGNRLRPDTGSRWEAWIYPGYGPRAEILPIPTDLVACYDRALAASFEEVSFIVIHLNDSLTEKQAPGNQKI